jgi:uncharacterized protein (DUF305 family)
VLSIRNFVLGCLAFAVLGAGATYALTAPHNPGANSVDVGFLQDMRYHHDQAVQMALILLQKPQTGANLDIRVIAQEIVQDQQLESGEIVDMLAQYGADTAADLSKPVMTWMHMSLPSASMPGLATDDQVKQLVAAQGAAADRLFCDLMTAHHQGGIHMAEYAEVHASRARVRHMASAMVQNQETDIIELSRLRPAG